MESTSSLSHRGQMAAKTVLRVDMELYEEAQQNLFDSVNNPSGALPLNMAENNLSWPILKSKMERAAVTFL